MAKITAIEPQKNSPYRFNIFLDGQFAFGADEDLVVEYRLIVGKQLTVSDVERLLFEAEVGKLMERMYTLWKIRPRSEKESRDYLKNLNFKRKIKKQEVISAPAIELSIKKLQQKGLLNDEKFAKEWVESRSKKLGKIALKSELFKKGISQAIIDKVLEDDLENEELAAKHLLQKKLKLWENLSGLDFKRKSYQFLLRRGFQFQVVKNVVEKFLQKE